MFYLNRVVRKMVEEQQNDRGEVKGRINREWWVRNEFGKDWWRSDKLDAVGWAAIFIWGGVVLLMNNTNYSANYTWWDSSSVFFAGAGIIVITEALIRMILPAFRKRIMLLLIIGFVMLAIGLGDLIGMLWPMVLFSIGIIILVKTFARGS